MSGGQGLGWFLGLKSLMSKVNVSARALISKLWKESAFWLIQVIGQILSPAFVD